MHCAAGDGLGIIAGAAVAARWHLPMWADISLEYFLGFGFGWTIFQAFAMREMAGGSYRRALQQTFLPEFLSMNLLMTGMIVTTRFLMPYVDGSADPLAGGFWFVMSMALVAGFVLAYPVNWWLVANGLKHGMITVRPAAPPTQRSNAVAAGMPSKEQTGSSADEHGVMAHASMAAKAAMTLLTIACLAIGVALAYRLAR